MLIKLHKISLAAVFELGLSLFMIKAGISEGSRPLGRAKWPWPCCLLLLCQRTKKNQKTWCRQTDAAGTDEGSNPSIATPFPRNPGRCSGNN